MVALVEAVALPPPVELDTNLEMAVMAVYMVEAVAEATLMVKAVAEVFLEDLGVMAAVDKDPQYPHKMGSPGQ